MSLTPEDIELRREGLTSTDMSKVCGLNRYGSAIEVYLDKRGKPIPVEDNEAMYWGRRLELPIAERYREELGACGHVVLNAGTVKEPMHGWMMATPDAFVLDSNGELLWGVELKTAGSARQVARWGPSGGAIVPEEYLVQCCWCMAVCNLDRWDIAVLLGAYHGFEYRQYTLTRDLALEAKLIEIGREFWTEHVLEGQPPPPDGSESARRALAQLYPADETAIMPADDETEALVNDLWIAKQDYDEATTEFERCKQALQAEITTAEGVVGRNFRVTWKANKKGSRVFRYSGRLFRQKVEVHDAHENNS